MATNVVMPQMGESIAEGTIVRWIKKVGESVDRDEPLFEISTDKVDAEIPSPGAGVLTEIKVKEGETVPVNAVVAVIGGESSVAAERVDLPDLPDLPAKAGSYGVPEAAVGQPEAGSGKPEADSREPEAEDRQRSSPLVRRIAREHDIDISRITGTGVSGRVTKDDILAFIQSGPSSAASTPPAPSAPAPSASAPSASAPSASAPSASAPSTSAPSASAPGGATADRGGATADRGGATADRGGATADRGGATADRAGAMEGRGKAAPPAARPAQGGGHVPVFKPGERVEVVPMTIMRKKIAEHMVLSAQTSPHVYSVYEVDFHRLSRLRDKKKKEYEGNGAKLSYTALVAKATVDAIRAFPFTNASIDGDTIVYKKDINLGIAVALDQGLIVPVIRNADEKNLLGLSRAIDDLAARARAKKLSPDDVQGGTFTITNPGIFGAVYGLPLINQPQVAILGVGAIEKRAVVVSGSDAAGGQTDAIAIHPTCHISLGYDHRLIDGADAGRFLTYLKERLEHFEEEWM